MNFHLQSFTSAPSQHYQTPMNADAIYTAPTCTPTDLTFGQADCHSYPAWQNSQVLIYNGTHSNPYFNRQHQTYNVSDNFSHSYQTVVPQNYPTTYVPPDPFCSNKEPVKQDTSPFFKPSGFPIQAKEQILEEIVRECNEIERRSISSESPVSSWSSDEHESSETRACRPYKSPEKKERKKAQNRLAATRYREKKRREKEEAMTCIEGLSVTNGKLKDQVSELEREIRYFKKFMREMGMKNVELHV